MPTDAHDEARCLFCRDELNPDGEMDDGSDIPPDAPGVCSECYARWHDALLYERRAITPEQRAFYEAAREEYEAERAMAGLPLSQWGAPTARRVEARKAKREAYDAMRAAEARP